MSLFKLLCSKIIIRVKTTPPFLFQHANCMFTMAIVASFDLLHFHCTSIDHNSVSFIPDIDAANWIQVLEVSIL